MDEYLNDLPFCVQVGQNDNFHLRFGVTGG